MVQAANALPGSAERIFVESDPDFMNRSAQLGNRVLDLAAALMEQVCVVCHCCVTGPGYTLGFASLTFDAACVFVLFLLAGLDM